MPVRLNQEIPGFPLYEIDHPTARARVAVHGAHLMEWAPAGHQPVIYLSPAAVLREGKAIRGGIPVCWPWFGPHPAFPDLPAHGFARTRFWTLTDSEETDTGVSLTFTLEHDAATRRLWEHEFRLELTLRIGAELHASLRMYNPGAEPYVITSALHSYLAVAEISGVTVAGLEDADYLDAAVTPHVVRRQQGPITITEEVDRDYRHAGPVQVIDQDPAAGRIITVSGSGSQCTVVWNPWIEKTRSMSDLPEDAWHHFVCVETANAWEDIVTVNPGAMHELAVSIRVS